jgi:NCS1 family nucleobase:cation symporter-1
MSEATRDETEEAPSANFQPVKYKGVEVRSIDWVPEQERHGKLWHQAPLWFLGNFQYFTIAVGFVGPSLGLSLWWTILASVAGIGVGTIFMAFHGSQGPKLGLPQMIQSRAQFGYSGVIVVTFAAFFTYMAFNVTDQVLLSQGLAGTFHWNATLMAVISASLAALLAILGHDWVHRVFRVLLYISFPLITIITFAIIFGKAGGHATSVHYGFTISAFMAQFTTAAAYNITYAPYVSDYSRYLPKSTSSKKVIASVFFGAGSSAVWLIAIGAWLAIRLGATDGLVGLQTAGNNVVHHLGGLAAFFSVSALLATMGMNAYGAMLCVLTGIDSFKKVKPTRNARVITILILAVVWYVIASTITGSGVNTLFTALTLMLYLLVPWTATNLVDYFFVRRGHYAITSLFTPKGIYGRWGRRGLLAYLIGLLAEVPFMMLTDIDGLHYIGPAARALGNTDISFLVGFVVTCVAYLLLARTLDVAGEQPAVEESERELKQAFKEQ